MKRIEIVFGAKPYFVTGVTLQAVKAELAAAMSSGEPSWFKVKTGEGRVEDAYLLLTPGVPIAVVSVEPATNIDVDTERSESFSIDMF